MVSLDPSAPPFQKQSLAQCHIVEDTPQLLMR